MNLTPGDPAPPFTLPDADGNDWSLEEHRGAPAVLYFYPRDDTPGCTTQACDIRDRWEEFRALDVAVVGISPDEAASHATFAEKYELPHTLLSDPDRSVIETYGAWGERSMYGKTYQGVIRSSVVIDAKGAIAAVFPKIQPKQQSTKTLQAVKDLLG